MKYWRARRRRRRSPDRAGGWVGRRTCVRTRYFRQFRVFRARPRCFGLFRVVFGRARVVSGCFGLFLIVREQERRRMSQTSLKNVVD